MSEKATSSDTETRTRKAGPRPCPNPCGSVFPAKTSPSLLPPAPSASPSRPDKRISGVAQGTAIAFIRRNRFSTVWVKDSAPDGQAHFEQTGISDKQADRQVSRAKDTSDKQTVRANKRPGRMPEQKCSQSAATTAPRHRNRLHPQKPFFNGPGEGFRTGRTGALRTNRHLGQTGGQAGASDKQTVRANRRPGRIPEQKCSQFASAATHGTTAPQPHGHKTGSASKAEPVIGKAPKGLRLRIIPGMRAEYPQRRLNRPRRPHWAPWRASAGSCPDLPSAPRSATRGRPSAQPIRRPNRSAG